MLLPGGLWHGGERRRDFAFEPLTGEVELAVAESAVGAPNLPCRVTTVLAAALREVGGEPASPESVRGLCVADRQFLVRQLAAWLGRDDVWLTARCGHCGGDFDFFLQQSALPVKEGAQGASLVTVDTSLGRCRLRLPTGADQEAVAELDDETRALRVLVERCLLSVGDEAGGDGGAPALSDADLERIEKALEAAAPEVALRVRSRCPDCGQPNDVAVDPYLCLDPDGGDLLSEIHVLASTYHWSEPEILALPRHRRQRYLELVDRARGMVS